LNILYKVSHHWAAELSRELINIHREENNTADGEKSGNKKPKIPDVLT